MSPFQNVAYNIKVSHHNNITTIIISKGTKLSFYLKHYDYMVRVSFKLGLWSVIIGIVSFIIGIISILK